MFSCAGGAFDGSAGAAVGAAVACGSCAGGAVAFGSLVAYQACGVFGLTWFRLACGANLWGWLPCVDWVVGVLGTHFSAYNPEFPLLRSRFLNKKPFIYRFFAQKLAPEHL